MNLISFLHIGKACSFIMDQLRLWDDILYISDETAGVFWETIITVSPVSLRLPDYRLPNTFFYSELDRFLLFSGAEKSSPSLTEIPVSSFMVKVP